MDSLIHKQQLQTCQVPHQQAQVDMPTQLRNQIQNPVAIILIDLDVMGLTYTTKVKGWKVQPKQQLVEVVTSLLQRQPLRQLLKLKLFKIALKNQMETQDCSLNYTSQTSSLSFGHGLGLLFEH